jgi:hypothetical protein
MNANETLAGLKHVDWMYPVPVNTELHSSVMARADLITDAGAISDGSMRRQLAERKGEFTL